MREKWQSNIKETIMCFRPSAVVGNSNVTTPSNACSKCGMPLQSSDAKQSTVCPHCGEPVVSNSNKQNGEFGTKSL